jgi:hypothetical protein
LASKVIYTANFGNYDDLRPICQFKGWDRVVFTDNKNLKVEGWKTIFVSGEGVRKQREIKILSNKYLKDYSLSIYQDANMKILSTPDEYLEVVKYQGGFMTANHPTRTSIYEEALKIVDFKKDKSEIVFKHIVNLFEFTKMPDNYGLFETGVIIRDNSKEVARLENKWYKYLMMGTHRDQISLPFAKFMTGINISTFSAYTRNCFFERFNHLR